jgi:hypothetical protein
VLEINASFRLILYWKRLGLDKILIRDYNLPKLNRAKAGNETSIPPAKLREPGKV